MATCSKDRAATCGRAAWSRHSAREGHTVQLVCQEPYPERYDCIAEAYRYHLDGRVETMFTRDVPYAGRCIMHKPQLGDTLPVYVWDKYDEYTNVVPMINLSDDAIESYVARNVEVVRRVVERWGVTAMHANHAVLMSVVAQRVSAETGVPYAVMPHGSALEYAVKPDPRFRVLATGAFAAAGCVFVHGEEMRTRVQTVLPDVPNLDEKFSVLPLGVHTAQFEPVPRERRREKIGRLLVSLADKPRGRRPGQLAAMLDDVRGAADADALRRVLSSLKYETKAPDEDLEEKLQLVDWEHDAVLLYVGRLISAKGFQSGLAALPLLLARGSRDPPDRRGSRSAARADGSVPLGAGGWRPRARRADRGLRADARRRSGWRVVGLAGADQDQDLLGRPLSTRRARRVLRRSRSEHVRADRVIFTGYLTHEELQHLFPCCDAGIFPVIVKEAGPLVFLEALASGCFPLGTYFGGMQASIDAIAELFPAHITAMMKLSPRDTVADIVRNVLDALHFGVRYKDVLSRTAQARYDWTSVARKLAMTLDGLSVASTSTAAPAPAHRLR